jgi:hypothetical protein
MMNNLEKMNFEDQYGFPFESNQPKTVLTDEEKHFMGIDSKNAPGIDPDDAEDAYEESFDDYEDDDEEATESEELVDQIIEEAKLLESKLLDSGMLEMKTIGNKSVLLESEIKTFTDSEYKRFVDEINKKVWTGNYDTEKEMLIYMKVA